MLKKSLLSLAALLPLALTATLAAEDAGKTLPLFDPSADGVEKRFTPPVSSADQVTVARSTDPSAPGMNITINPGKDGYPGVNFAPASGDSWDLSAFGHVTARVMNTGTKGLNFSLRVDNKGDWKDSPWNAESTYIKPGAEGTVTVIFGFSYGRQPGYALKPAAVANLLLFATKAADAQSFRIESIEAGGPAGEKPPVDPRSVRVKPENGAVFGAGVTFDAAKQIDAKGVQAAVDGSALKITFPPAKGEQSASLKTVLGKWDLTDATEVRVKLKNTGSAPVTPSVQVMSNGGATDAVAAKSPIAPGAEQEIVVPFAAAVPWKGLPVPATATHGIFEGEKGTGTKFTSDSAGPIKIFATAEAGGMLTVESIVADTPVAVLPDWVGQRPPVEGDWVKTFDDEFDGTEIDQKKWNIAGENYWDKATHWSKDNLILGGGVVKEHFEKKTGYQNDDPKQRQTPYACGYLDTYGKWVQRYGYFEARVKLPVAPGLWPTFWLMPDRGVEAGPQWKRQDTGNGGMEFDIMEHLTRWGPHRYNVADHWDGYGETHKSNGSTCNYVQPDKDGFITCGFLWLPGSIKYYCNGQLMVEWDDARVSNIQSNIIFETTTGGWDNNRVDDKQLPVDYVIDYVRVWQRKDLASSVDGYKTPAPAVVPAAK